MIEKTFAFAGAVVLSVAAIHAADWPQWQGPDRSRRSSETGLLTEWPAGGPALVWTATGIGAGYGSMAVAGDRVFVQSTRGRNSMVIALNRADGKEVWSKALGATQADDRGPGPRGTPTVDGDRLYVLSENGDLMGLKIDGTMLWQRNILRDFSGRQLQWLISESPLVDGPHVIVSPGGPGAGIVKLDKMTGATVWTAKELSDSAGYSSVIAADVQGVRTYLTFTASAGVGVRASDGKLMFRYANAANYVANVATPIFSNNKVFFTSAYGTGGGLLDLTVQNGEVKAKEVYFTRSMNNHHGGRRPCRRLSLRVQRLDPGLPRLCDRQDDVAGSQRGQRVGDLRRRPPLHSGRGQRHRPCGSDAVRLPRERAFPHSRQGLSELGASCHQRRPPVHPQSGHAARLRHHRPMSFGRDGAVRVHSSQRRRRA